MRVQLLAITFLTALSLTACGSGKDTLEGTWKDPEDGEFLTIEEKNDALRLSVPPDDGGDVCEGLIEGEESPYKVTIICTDPIGNQSDIEGHLEIVDENKLNLIYEQTVYSDRQTSEAVLVRVER